MPLHSFLLTATLLLASLVASAQGMLVSTDWLQDHLSDSDVVVLHAGSQADYDAGHIPGARLVRLDDISVTGPGGLRLQLPSTDALRNAFGKLGVTDRNTVIVYHATPAVQSATRVWFTLDYLGIGDRAAFLDGGLALWKQQSRPLSKDPVAPASGTFTPRPRPIRVVSAEWLRSHLNDPAVLRIDARTPNFYSGADKGMMPRAGHIPGAINAPYLSFFAEDGRLKSREELRRLLKAGDQSPEPLRITYCHIGQQATVPYFVSRFVGLDVRLFDGSYQEWSNRSEFPIEAETTHDK